jgi:MFS family permease
MSATARARDRAIKAETEAGTGQPTPQDAAPGSRRSRAALNACNFFVSETITIITPFLADFLRERRWSYGAIGVASAMPGLGVLLSMTPVGMWVDRSRHRRPMLAVAALLAGGLFVSVPLVPATPLVIDPMMFVAGTMESFFAPVLYALALALAGAAGVHRLVGANQAWNHIGSIFASIAAMGLVQLGGAGYVFYGLAFSAVASAVSCMAIKGSDLRDPPRRQRRRPPLENLVVLFRNRQVLVFLGCVMLFHLANAPGLPLVTLNVRRLGGTATHVAGLVLIAQATMVPVAYLAGYAAERFGRKVVFGTACCILPVRLALAGMAGSTWQLLTLQVLDGMGAGIYGVVIASICADLAGRSGRFNTLMGLAATAMSWGAVAGPTAGGFVAERFGFRLTFFALAAVAAAACVLCWGFLRDSGRREVSRR